MMVSDWEKCMRNLLFLYRFFRGYNNGIIKSLILSIYVRLGGAAYLYPRLDSDKNLIKLLKT